MAALDPRPGRPRPPYTMSESPNPGKGGGGGKKPTPAKPAPARPSQPAAWNSTQQSAYDQLYSLLGEFGLTSLAGTVKQLLLDGVTDSASIQLTLQGTNEWKQRFAGNEMLKQKGLGVLSPAEYLAVERSYAQVMKNYGLPAGFYDDPSDFAQFIGNNVSASEVQTRVQSYADLANREDAATRQQLQSMGMSQGDLLAFMMDPTRATPLIQNKYQTALLGSAARRAGVTADNGHLSELAARGVTEDAASQGYGLIAGSLKDAASLAAISGEDYGINDMQAEVFGNDGVAANKRKRLASQERGRFSGSAGTTSGAQRRSTNGSY